MGPEMLAYGSQCSANFHLTVDCLITSFKLKYEDLGNIKTGSVNGVVVNLHQIKQRNSFCETPGKGLRLKAFKPRPSPLTIGLNKPYLERIFSEGGWEYR